MKNKIADFIDTVLLFICLSVLGIIFARYFTSDISVVMLFGFTFSLAVTFFIGLFKRKKQLPKDKQKLIDNALTQFIFSSKEFCVKHIFDALSKKYAPICKNNIIYINNVAVVVNLVATPLSLTFLADYYSRLVGKTKKIIFLTAYGADAKVNDIVDELPNIKIEIFNFNKVYKLLESLDSLPENKIVMIKKRTSLKIFAEAFSVNKAKKYLIASLLLLLSSLFMPYSVYYIIVSSILIVVAILCRIDIIKLTRRKIAK